MRDPSPPIRAAVFDLGGVLVELDFGRAFAHWGRCANVPPERLRERFRVDRFHERYECGEIDDAAFYASLRDSLGIDIPDEAFAQGWGAIFPGEVPGMRGLVRTLAAKLPLYVFSNTNVTHHRIWTARFAELLRPFRKVFVSCELGKRKPRPEAFHAVAQAIDVPPENILFLDDTLANVEGARAVGMTAVHVRSIADVEEAIRRL